MKRVGRLIVDSDVSEEDYTSLLFALQRDTPFVSQGQTGMRIDVLDPREDDGLCHCENPTVERTTAKGTPAAREFCECGGFVKGDEL